MRIAIGEAIRSYETESWMISDVIFIGRRDPLKQRLTSTNLNNGFPVFPPWISYWEVTLIEHPSVSLLTEHALVGRFDPDGHRIRPHRLLWLRHFKTADEKENDL